MAETPAVIPLRNSAMAFQRLEDGRCHWLDLNTGAVSPADDLSAFKMYGQYLVGTLFDEYDQIQKLLDAASPKPPEEVPPGESSPKVEAPPAAEPTVKLNVNKATEQELADLDGISNVKAKKAIEEREARGPFKTVHDFFDRADIPPQFRKDLRDQIEV